MSKISELEELLDEWMCECGRPKWDHDFGGGGNENSGCSGFNPVKMDAFTDLVEIYHEQLNEAVRHTPSMARTATGKERQPASI